MQQDETVQTNMSLIKYSVTCGVLHMAWEKKMFSEGELGCNGKGCQPASQAFLAKLQTKEPYITNE